MADALERNQMTDAGLALMRNRAGCPNPTVRSGAKLDELCAAGVTSTAVGGSIARAAALRRAYRESVGEREARP